MQSWTLTYGTIASSLAIPFASRVVILCVDGIIAQPSALRHTGLVHFFQARSGARPTCRRAQEPLRRSRRNRTSQASPEDLKFPGWRLCKTPQKTIFAGVCGSRRRQGRVYLLKISWHTARHRKNVQNVRRPVARHTVPLELDALRKRREGMQTKSDRIAVLKAAPASAQRALSLS